MKIAEKISEVYSQLLDASDKELGLLDGAANPTRLSSGLLVFDLILGGGLTSGFHVISGPEASGKSTEAVTILRSAIELDMPIRRLYDPEGTTDDQYTSGILGVDDLAQIFGQRDPKTGKYLSPPLCRYTDTHVLEDIYNSIHKSLNAIPDKRYRLDTKQWYLVFGKKRHERDLMTNLGINPDKKLYTQTGNYWCPVADSNFQALFIIDSFPAMVPEKVDDEDDAGNALALQARHHAKYIPRITGKLRAKHAILLGVNQIRLNPGVRYGSPEYEGQGTSIKFHSSVRSIFREKSVPEGFEKSSESYKFNIEPSVEGKGMDSYAFKSISNIKNKHGTPFLKGLARIWVADYRQKARGFDPVFDVFSFLQECGLIEGSRKKSFTINLPKFERFTFDWSSFKTLVLAETTNNPELLSKAKKLLHANKLTKLQATCHRLLRSGEALAFYNKHRSLQTKTQKSLVDLEE